MEEEKEWMKKAKEEWAIRIGPRSSQREQEAVLISMLRKQKEENL